MAQALRRIPEEALEGAPKRCLDCAVKRDCPVAAVLAEDQRTGRSRIHPHQMTLIDGGHLYWQDQPFEALYLVVSGTLKRYNVDLDGNERVRGFQFPGSMIGFDGIARGTHGCHASALEEGVVCRFAFDELLSTSVRTPQLQARLFKHMSCELVHAETLAGDYSAAERLATFLLDVAETSGPQDVVRLPMSRRDIANYLRLAKETVSRVITDFDRKGLIERRGPHIEITNLKGLRAVAEPSLAN